ncbi:hypothetical protein, partial [Mariniphaga sediminis]|uniref:hypothetical protein n=1 Tax=Mariniphaga sediminis TaxID=1628158 RepID=UPI0035658A61
MKKLLLLVFSATLMLFLTTNVMAQNGKSVKVANNSELVKALNDPNITSVEVTQSGYYDELGAEVNAGNVITFAEFTGGSRGSCTLEITKTDVCFNADGTATSNVAIAATSGDPSCPIQPTTGAYGWSSPQSGTTLTFLPTVDMYEYTMNFEVSAPGFYSLTYKWNDFDLTTTQVVFYSTPDITFTNDADDCETISIAYVIDAGTTTGGTYTEVWEVTDGSSNTVT